MARENEKIYKKCLLGIIKMITSLSPFTNVPAQFPSHLPPKTHFGHSKNYILGKMSDNAQIIYMQARLVGLMAKETGSSVASVATLFKEQGVFHYVKRMWDLFHIEGDLAVLEDVKQYLKSKGVQNV